MAKTGAGRRKDADRCLLRPEKKSQPRWKCSLYPHHIHTPTHSGAYLISLTWYANQTLGFVLICLYSLIPKHISKSHRQHEGKNNRNWLTTASRLWYEYVACYTLLASHSETLKQLREEDSPPSMLTSKVLHFQSCSFLILTLFLSISFLLNHHFSDSITLIPFEHGIKRSCHPLLFITNSCNFEFLVHQSSLSPKNCF